MGKIIGGSHRLNNMLYVPPNIDDIKELFPDNFNKERDIQHYFKRAEQMTYAGNINLKYYFVKYLITLIY